MRDHGSLAQAEMSRQMQDVVKQRDELKTELLDLNQEYDKLKDQVSLKKWNLIISFYNFFSKYTSMLCYV